MKHLLRTLLAALVITITASNTNAQTTYYVTQNFNWKSNGIGSYPNPCTECTFMISDGVTLTIDRDVTLIDPTFVGGTVISNKKTEILLSSSSPDGARFLNTNFIMNGSSQLIGNAPITMENSTFLFNGTSSFKPSQELNLINTKIQFAENSTMVATGGPINMYDGSKLIAGDGNLSSTANIFINGPVLNIYDSESMIGLANKNNYYMNSNPYNSISNGQTYVTTNNNLNCGGSNPNPCVSNRLYGPAMMNSNGIVNGFNLLPVTLIDFKVENAGKAVVSITWATSQESNSEYFSVEKSENATVWQSIGKVKAQGSSSTVTQYRYTDESAKGAVIYYRLKMVDADGKYAYSTVKIVKNSSAANVSVSVYPNPASDYVVVAPKGLPNGKLVVQLFNQFGQPVRQMTNQNAAGGNIVMQLQQLIPGNYVIRVTDSTGGSQSFKVVVKGR